MNGKDALGPSQLRDAVFLLQQIDGDEGGLPVVAVDDIWGPVQLSRSFDDSPGEEGEPLAVVEMSIELPTLEVVFVVYKPVGDPLPLQMEDATVDLPPGQGDIEVFEKGHLFPPLLADALVQRKDDLDLVALPSQSLGQGAGHIGQSAGLNKGSNLGGGK